MNGCSIGSDVVEDIRNETINKLSGKVVKLLEVKVLGKSFQNQFNFHRVYYLK